MIEPMRAAINGPYALQYEIAPLIKCAVSESGCMDENRSATGHFRYCEVFNDE